MKTKNKFTNSIQHTVAVMMLLAATGMTSCNFLDFDESIGFDSQEEVYEVFSRTEQSLTNVYTYLKEDFGSINGAMRDCAIDDAHYVWSNSNVHSYNNGRWSEKHTVDAQWSEYYAGIRSANMFIKCFNETDYSKYKWNSDYDTWMEKAQYWESEARVLRSMFLFELARRYGDIPLAVDIYTVENVNGIKKNSFGEVMQYISDECKAAAQVLPENYNNVASKQTGRITKGAALALRSRALLYAASPLFSQDSQEKWIEAAKAAKEVIDLNLYTLTDEESVNNLDSKELILERRMPASCDFEKKNFPISFDKGNTGTCPSQNLVDAFQTKNGYDVVLTEAGWKCDDPSFDAQAPYANRDKRFYKTVLYDGAKFKGKTLNCAEGGAEGQPVLGASKTGYYLRKYILENVELSPNEKPAIHTWVLFRYAEILLNYAEAMNNAYGPTDNADGLNMTALEALNEVRTRSGMPAITPAQAHDKASFQTLLEHEKRVEFAFEDHRFWDLRRWKEGAQLGADLMGVKIVIDGEKKYEPVVVEAREWDNKKYLYPIPVNELYKNKNLYPQNLGW